MLKLDKQPTDKVKCTCTYKCFKDCSIFDLLGCKFLTICVCILFYYGFSNVCLVFKLYAFFYWLSTFIFVFEELKYEEYPRGKVNNFHSYSKLDFSCLGSDLHCLTYTFWLAFIYSQSERNKNAAILNLTDFCVK